MSVAPPNPDPRLFRAASAAIRPGARQDPIRASATLPPSARQVPTRTSATIPPSSALPHVVSFSICLAACQVPPDPTYYPLFRASGTPHPHPRVRPSVSVRYPPIPIPASALPRGVRVPSARRLLSPLPRVTCVANCNFDESLATAMSACNASSSKHSEHMQSARPWGQSSQPGFRGP